MGIEGELQRGFVTTSVDSCIISTAQQARPKVMGQSDPVRVQLMTLSAVVVTNPSRRTPSIPIPGLPSSTRR